MNDLTRQQKEACERFGLDPDKTSFAHPFHHQTPTGGSYHITCEGLVVTVTPEPTTPDNALEVKPAKTRRETEE